MLRKLKCWLRGEDDIKEEDLVDIRKRLMKEIANSLGNKDTLNHWYLHKESISDPVFRNIVKDIDLVWKKTNLHKDCRLYVSHANKYGFYPMEVNLDITGYEYLEEILAGLIDKGKLLNKEMERKKLDKVAYYILKKFPHEDTRP